MMSQEKDFFRKKIIFFTPIFTKAEELTKLHNMGNVWSSLKEKRQDKEKLKRYTDHELLLFIIQLV